MQSSFLVKYTTRSLYIRMFVHSYQRRSPPLSCPRVTPLRHGSSGYKGDRSSLPEVTKEASNLSSEPPENTAILFTNDLRARLPQKNAAAKLNSPQSCGELAIFRLD